jgi:hypothetical protein
VDRPINLSQYFPFENTLAFTYINTAFGTKWYIYGYLIASCDSVRVYKGITSYHDRLRLKLWMNYVFKLEDNIPVKEYHIGLITVTVAMWLDNKVRELYCWTTYAVSLQSW